MLDIFAVHNDLFAYEIIPVGKGPDQGDETPGTTPPVDEPSEPVEEPDDNDDDIDTPDGSDTEEPDDTDTPGGVHPTEPGIVEPEPIGEDLNGVTTPEGQLPTTGSELIGVGGISLAVVAIGVVILTALRRARRDTH